MGTARATKAADKSQVCRKLVVALQKLYGRSVPKIDLSVARENEVFRKIRHAIKMPVRLFPENPVSFLTSDSLRT